MTKGPHTLKKAKKKAPVGVFVATVIVVFFSTLSAADSIGFVPYYIDGSAPASHVDVGEDLALSDLPQLGDEIVGADGKTAAQSAPKKDESTYPVRIVISSLSINLPVQNPKTTDLDALDALLVNGPARYSKSAKLGADGNVIIFAHSSHLPIVHNKMYQAFNNIPNARNGDTVTLTGENGIDYIYEVDSVVRADTNDGDKVPLMSPDGNKLILVTCDTLTGKSARFVLTASFVGTN
jgi:LPXTG-site transpeptidase (sortase) family protein